MGGAGSGVRKSGITVDGKPLEHYLREQSAAEIAEVQQAEIREKTWHPRAGRSRFGNTSGARTAPGEVVYTRHGRETHIIIAGTMFPWAEKAPYVRSGESVLGAVEYDEKADEIKCHECGRWFRALSPHLRDRATRDRKGRIRPRPHAMSPKVYKVKHGLNLVSALSIPSLCLSLSRRSTAARAERRPATSIAKLVEEKLADGMGLIEARRAAAQQYSAHYRFVANCHKRLRKGLAAPEPRKPPNYAQHDNLHAQCRAQLSVRILALSSRLGRMPTHSDLTADGISPCTVRRVFAMTVRQTFSLLKISPSPQARQQFSDDEVLACLKQRARVLGHPPSRRELKGFSPSYDTVIRRFGGLPAALLDGGLLEGGSMNPDQIVAKAIATMHELQRRAATKPEPRASGGGALQEPNRSRLAQTAERGS